MRLRANDIMGKRRVRILVLGLPVLLGILGVGALLALLYANVEFRDALDITSNLGLVFAAMVCTAQSVWNRRAAGPVLLDCGARPRGSLLILATAFCLLFFLLSVFIGRVDRTDVVFWLATLVILVNLWMMARIQLREHGVLANGNLTKWRWVDSFKWTGQHGTTLSIHTTSAVFGMGIISVPVPPGQKEAIERRLAERITTDGNES